MPKAIAIEPNSYVAGMLSRMPQYDERPFSRGQSEPTSFWTIAIGVAVGITIAGFVAFAVRMYFVQQALNQFNQSMQQINAESQRSVQEMRQREAVRQERALELLNQQKLEKAAAQQIANNQMRQQLDEVARKEAAWQRFYKKPAHCDTADGQAFMDCANGHIRAKRDFEEKYAAGKI